MEILNIIMGKLSGFVNLFDSIRIVDPANKIYLMKNAENVCDKGTCYSFWLKDRTCTNCISMRALLEKETFIKIEYCKGRIFLITAVPMEHNNEIYIVEMLKDITDKNIFIDKDKIKDTNIAALVEEMNEKSMKDKLTGLFNKNYVNERLYFDLKINLLNDKKLNAMFININNYKEINNKHGQEISDNILKNIAGILVECVGDSSALISRYDEDEFFIALNEAESEKTNMLLQKMKEKLLQNNFIYDGYSIDVEISFAGYGFNDFIINSNDSANNKTAKEKVISELLEKERLGSLEFEKSSALDKYIDDIRDVLNEISAASQDFGLEKERLIISQCLDELIVEYYK
jgi:diguanylate cyclase (GGDEF)-like protein